MPYEVPNIPVLGAPCFRPGLIRLLLPASRSRSSRGRAESDSWSNCRESCDAASSPDMVAHSSSDPVAVNEGRISGKQAALCHDRAKLSMLFTPPACLKRAEKELDLEIFTFSFPCLVYFHAHKKSQTIWSFTFASGCHSFPTVAGRSGYSYPILTMYLNPVTP